MNYLQALAKARTLLQQGHNAQAVQTAAAALESLFVGIFHQFMDTSTPARQRQLTEA